MDEKQQQEFIGWLGDKLQAKDQGDLQKKLQTLGDDGIRKAYDQFVSEKSDAEDNQEEAEDNGIQTSKDGGKLQYIKCLKAFAKGGIVEMEKCGCGGKMEKGGQLVNTGSISIKKDKGSRKEASSDKGTKAVAKKQRISHGYDPAEKADKPKLRTKGGSKESEKKEMKSGGRMEMAKGGTVKKKEEMKKGGVAKCETGGTLTSTLITMARGGSINESSDLIVKYPSGIKDPKKEALKLKGKRIDSKTKEANPGKKEYLDTGKKKIEHSAVTKVPTGAAGKKLQAGGSMAGTMGGMMSGAGVRNPNSGPKLVKKKVKVPMP